MWPVILICEGWYWPVILMVRDGGCMVLAGDI